MPPRFRSILCADWSKNPRGREVYRADCVERRILRESPPDAWTVGNVVARARELEAKGPTLVAFDAALGLPRGYFRAGRSHIPAWRSCKTFVDWLAIVGTSDELFTPVSDSASWSLRQPFFALPAGKGTRRRWEARLEELAIESRRTIDRLTSAKPPFIVSGMPGSVGSAACDLWRGLAQLLGRKHQVAVWPFDGTLAELSQDDRIVVGEIYPRAAYSAALAAEPPADRVPLILAKNKPETRDAAIAVLIEAEWVRDQRVRLDGLEEARDSADAFDALLTAAALLRCILEETPLSNIENEDAVAEGGILGSGSVALEKRAQRFSTAFGPVRSARSARRQNTPSKEIACPIPVCRKVFRGSRGGWDAHVASLRNHKEWRRSLTDPWERKRLFRRLYGGFFR